jgi:hypothetical protein
VTKVVVHVGTPKTGTTFLQSVLFENRARLQEHGFVYPAERFDSHFLAALDLMRLNWGGLEDEAVGAWDDVARVVRRAGDDRTVVISHEILARASRSHVARALESFAVDGVEPEVHVVLTARDLTRQVPAEWQENVKHRRTLGYEAFLEQIRDPRRRGGIGRWFWSVQELPDILDRWTLGGEAVPPERVHVVTVPRGRGGGPLALWGRYVEALGLGEVDLDLDVARPNPSLGVAETALLRRINLAVEGRIAPPRYRHYVRELLAHQTLARVSSSARIGLPADLAAWVHEHEEAWIAELDARGYRVHGDLADLRGGEGPPWVDPDVGRDAEVADAAVVAITALIEECVRLEDELAAHAVPPPVAEDARRVARRVGSALKWRLKALRDEGLDGVRRW